MNNKWVCYAIYGEDSGYSYSDLSDIDKEKLQNYLTYETKKQNEMLQCLKKKMMIIITMMEQWFFLEIDN